MYRFVALSFASLTALVASSVLLAVSPQAQAQPLLPDLVSDPPGATYDDGTPIVPQVYSDSYSSRLLLRFDGYVHNRGPGPIELRGSSPFGELSSPIMGAVTQRVYDSGGGFQDMPSDARLQYETSDDHHHWHLKDVARYSLWTSARTGEVGASSKVGFCLADIEAVDPHPAQQDYRYTADLDGCKQEHPGDPTSGPGAQAVRMGVSPGWRDVYDRFIALQWVDVSNTPPGKYWLRADINPTGSIMEDPNAGPNAPAYASVQSTVPGYLAEPVTRGHVPANTASTVTLQAAAFAKSSDTISRRFRVAEQPAHGRVSVTGQVNQQGWFSDPVVTYTPDAGYFGPDSFKFAAKDTSSFFPRTQPSAAVAMTVGTGAPGGIALSGAPASMAAGTAAQLSAIVTSGPSAHVTWRVDGVPGGDSTVGTVTPQGLFVAPNSVPPGGTVHIDAATDDGASDGATIAITPRPSSRPAIDIPGPSARAAPPLSGKLSARLRGHRTDRDLIVRVVPRRAGLIRFYVSQHGRRVASARARAEAATTLTRAIKLPRSFGHDRGRSHRHHALRVTGYLTSGGRLLQRWRGIIR